MFRKNPVLKYESAIEVYPDIITSAKNHIPNWYKKIPKWKNNEIFSIDEGFQKTLKNCIPFSDSFTVGYMLVLPNDLYVKNNNGTPYLTWNRAEFPPGWRKEVTNLNLVPYEHYPIEYIWHTGVSQTIPIGYSLLFTHPLNRHDLPFTTLSAIIDGGLIMSGYGDIPFYIKKNFEGIIPQGTPIAQIIPFRQENWQSKKTKGLIKKGQEHYDKSSSLVYGWYKKTFWTRKKYD